MNVLGLDLSVTGTGIAYADGTSALVGLDGAEGDDRLLVIADRVAYAVQFMSTDVDLVVIEDYVTNSKAASILGMVHGVVRSWLCRGHIPYALVPPATLKVYATGRGTADKADMRMELYKRVGIDLRDDNQVDAIWLRHMGLDHLGEPSIELPQAHRRALEKVRWP